MVLQNKYKARASRRYQEARGLAPQRGSSGRGRGRERKRVCGRGAYIGDAEDEAYEEPDRSSDADGSDCKDDFSVSGDKEDRQQDEHHDDESDSGAAAAAAAASFHAEPTKSAGSLRYADAGPSTSAASGRAGGDARSSKYAKRKIQSNAWRFEHASDEEADAEPGECSDRRAKTSLALLSDFSLYCSFNFVILFCSLCFVFLFFYLSLIHRRSHSAIFKPTSAEPEVDLRSAFAKARIDYAAEQQGTRNCSDDDDNDDDVDASLAYLHDRQRHRASLGASATSNPSSSFRPAARGSRDRQQIRTIDMPADYEEAQRANREWREKNDTRLKFWGRMEDELESRRRQKRSSGHEDAHRGNTQAQTLDGQDFLDSLLA